MSRSFSNSRASCMFLLTLFFFNDPATTEIYTLSLHDALPILEVVNAETAFSGACAPGDRLSIPVKHTTGRFYAADDELDQLEASGQVVLRYAPGHNPNGSRRDIAGICNERGNVFGLMPHPEHAVDVLTGSTDGLKIFESMRAHVGDPVLG